MKRKPKFRVGQVVSVRMLYEGDDKQRYRHGWQFGKIVKILRPHNIYYTLDGWAFTILEKYLRALTAKERAER